MTIALKARICGLFYLITTVAGLFYIVAGNGFVVEGNAAATAQKILGSESFYRLDITANLVAAMAYVVVIYLLYELLEPVNRGVALLALLFGAIGCVSAEVAILGDAAPLYLARAAQHAGAASAGQLEALGMVALRLSGLELTVGLVFFGVYCLLIGYLLFNSGFFPRTLGVLMAIAGACYLIDSFAALLAPELAHRISLIALGALVGEGALTLWLLIAGVDVPKWQQAVVARP